MFKQEKLKYNLTDFTGIISKEIMDFHYNKHYKAYTDNLNKFIAENDSLEGKKIEDIFSEISKYPNFLRNNAGGYYNHLFFFNCITPDIEKKQISEKMKKKIEENFQSFENFKELFQQKAMSVFGSGWVNLVLNKDGLLEIIITQNQDNTLMDFMEKKYGKTKLILNLDVWEHAYYLDYKNIRLDYINNFFKIINWSFVEKNIFSTNK